MMKKTRLCQEFVSTGACKYGVKCTFAHGESELRQVNPAALALVGGGGGAGMMMMAGNMAAGMTAPAEVGGG